VEEIELKRYQHKHSSLIFQHQNAFAWTVSKHSDAAQKIAATHVHGLCVKCYDIVEWRKRMGRYKPCSQPTKCVSCLCKKITSAYHVLCKDCGRERGKCEKCREERERVIPGLDELEERRLREEREREMSVMNEREKRTFLRKIEREEALIRSEVALAELRAKEGYVAEEESTA
jgi:hypothetical protein